MNFGYVMQANIGKSNKAQLGFFDSNLVQLNLIKVGAVWQV